MWAPLDAESWIERIIVRGLKHWFGITIKRYEFRWQFRMVRDSFIALYTAVIFYGVPEYILYTPMPWYVYSPKTWKWAKRLIKDNRADYVRRLGYLRARAVVLTQSEFE